VQTDEKPAGTAGAETPRPEDAEAPAENAEVRAASRALEKEPESESAYRTLATACARHGLEEPRNRKPVSLMTAHEVHRSSNPWPTNTQWDCPERKRYYLLEEAKQVLQDEIAAARASARKGLPPDATWKVAQAAPADAESDDADENEEEGVSRRRPLEDPRLVAWKSVAWQRAHTALTRTRSVPDKCPSLEALAMLENEAEIAYRTLRTVRELLEREASL
jgi:hypothetical protein